MIPLKIKNHVSRLLNCARQTIFSMKDQTIAHSNGDSYENKSQREFYLKIDKTNCDLN